MKLFLSNVSKLLKDESGQTLSEYALILALIALVVVAVATALGDKIKAIFQKVIDSLGS
ncbi:MAG: hypothetical protein UR28_C0039G0005 [Candidatus Peregrinibacteria bacterium GW2011_GWF2_33_10]|nr:MAG: hypothetical protein UR28_C0039G0005 [Candidatus Peregrinibacteria bacterium GW2011_GWF2_33_10]